MRFLLALIFVAIGTQAQAGTIACQAAPTGSTASHRDALTGGGYGFCQIDSCDSSLGYAAAPENNRCMKAPTVTWLSTTAQNVEGGPVDVILYAKLSRTPISPVQIQLKTSSSTATSSDFKIANPIINFTRAISDPIYIQVLGQSAYKPNSDIIIGFDSIVSGSATLSQDTLDLTLISKVAQSILTSLTVSEAHVTEGDVAQFTVTSSRVISTLFPTRINIAISGPAGNVSSLIMTALIPAKQTTTTFSVPTNLIPGYQGTRSMSLSVSALGYSTAGGKPTAKLVIDDTTAPSSDVYAVGYNRASKPSLFINGIQAPISGFASVGSVYVNSGHVYIGGVDANGNDVLSTDGVISILPGNMPKVVGITMFNGHLYVLGTKGTGFQSILWIDGIANPYASMRATYSMVSDANNLYIVGNDTSAGPGAYIDTNGVLSLVNDNCQYAISVAASGGHVYVYGIGPRNINAFYIDGVYQTTGFDYLNTLPWNSINALAVDSSGHIYFGGSLAFAGKLSGGILKDSVALPNVPDNSYTISAVYTYFPAN